MKPNGEIRKLSQEFELLPILIRPGGVRSTPYVRIQVRAGKTGSGASIKLSGAARNLLGINLADKSAHIQVYLSTLGIKIVKCRVDSEQARKVNTDGKCVAHEVIDILGLSEGDIWDCDAYAADTRSDGRSSAIIGSFPAALRDKLTGVIR